MRVNHLVTFGLCIGIAATAAWFAGCGAGDGGSDGSGGMDAEGGATCDGGGQIECNGVCVSASDPGHCGSCSTVCPGPSNGNGMATCTGTTPTCGIACTSGYHLCNGNQCLSNSDDPSTDGCVIADGFGIFVSPTGNDANPGTMKSPVRTIGHAMDLAKAATSRVYACGSAGTYDEHLVVSGSRDGVTVYGGLDCSNTPWVYDASKQAVVAPSTQGYALQVSGLASGVKFEDFGFTAQGASGYDTSGNGRSSIAAWVSGSSGVQFARTAFTAGDGAAGKDGVAFTSNHYSGTMTGNGANGLNGAAELICACPDGATSSTGGSGGNGLTLSSGTSGSAGNGADGGAAPAATPMGPFDGKGGVGESYSISPPSHTSCSGGDDGASGAGGSGGAGATSLGTLSSQWAPAAGARGGLGDPGQGGGGGGGSLGLNGQTTGAGGGGGGCGGCGGAGGLGGTGGGSSFALVVVSSTASLQSCKLVSGNGQKGGNGSTGEPGQGGGGGGTSGACSGRGGGPSGGGGGGGGGAGGNSVGVAWTGAASVTIDGAAISADVQSAAYFNGGSAGSGGSKGSGGSAASGGNAGQDGKAGIDGVVFAVKKF